MGSVRNAICTSPGTGELASLTVIRNKNSMCFASTQKQEFHHLFHLSFHDTIAIKMILFLPSLETGGGPRSPGNLNLEVVDDLTQHQVRKGFGGVYSDYSLFYHFLIEKNMGLDRWASCF